MRYLSEKCPYCGLEFREDDDVVVCPECATPHHRACWVAHGNCANAQKHAEGFVWKKTAAEPEPEKNEQNTEQKNTNSLDIICPDCGKVSPNGTLRCPDCGALLIPFSPTGGEPPIARFRPGFDAEELVGGMKAGDIALFCRVSGARYIKAFRKLAQKKKFSWNWGSGVFGPLWFFYRKLYKSGIIFLALSIGLSLWLLPASSGFYEAYDNAMYEASRIIEEQGEEAAYAVLEERVPEIQAKMKPMYLPMALQVLLHIAAAFVADRLYYKKARADIKKARSEGIDERSVQLILFKNGGTSLVWGAGAYAVTELLLMLGSHLLNK